MLLLFISRRCFINIQIKVNDFVRIKFNEDYLASWSINREHHFIDLYFKDGSHAVFFILLKIFMFCDEEDEYLMDLLKPLD